MKSKSLLSFVVLATAFTSQVYAQQYCAVGSEQWVAGCSASCTASWEGSDCPKTCTATAPAGYVIMNHREHNHSESNGGHDVSRIAAGQSFDYKRRVEQAYSYALDLAGKADNKSAEAKIKEDMNSAISEAESFNSTHQMVRLNVSASKHGSFIDRKRGWSNHSVELLVKCVVPPNLEDQLMKKYALN
jgi:hypothetical protein